MEASTSNPPVVAAAEHQVQPAAAAVDEHQNHPTAADVAAAHTQIGWKWKRSNLRGTKGTMNVYNKVKVLKEIRAQLGGEKARLEMYKKFERCCFGRYLAYKRGGQCAINAVHAMIGQQVTRPGARPDEVWFKVGENVVRFSRKEHALITGLRFGPTDFDVNAYYEYPIGGVYMRHIHGRDPLAVVV